ncbi:sensor histidine kinase [Myceligenerans xiligouense]|uniref:sensor histidine kinase n=1 Tax=Myceligenerans xiligouense TaxID=253184 RepID=UPI000F4F29B0|nr:histidine kinase [Myceligenerans xiligouense]
MQSSPEARRTRRQDAVLAAAVTVVTLGVVVLEVRLIRTDPSVALSDAQAWALGVLSCAQAVLLVGLRSRPVVTLAAVAACQVVLVAAVPDIAAHGIALLIAAYTVGAHRPVRAVLGVAVPAVLLEAVTAAAAAWGRPDAWTIVGSQAGSAALAYGGAAFVGSYVASRRRERELERLSARAQIAAQRERAETAVAAERGRIARELHDVAAHHLSGMIVQAAAVDRLIGRDDDAARSGAAWIRSQGKATLENLRQVVGLLRDDAGVDGNAPVPGLEALETLVEEARRTGTDVVLERTGGAVRLPPIADISCYRVVQQALTNVRQHAPGAAARVRLTYGPRDVELEVVNGPAARAPAKLAGGGGSGLIGMRERAGLIGADLAAGPADDGGWRVRLRLPVSPDDGRVGAGHIETGDPR